eukprot:COSAG06_NODE_12179_length_1410_cov_2.055598_2_plen_95_part_00
MPEPQAEPEVEVQPAELEPEHAHADIADDDEFTDHAGGPAAETELGLLSAGAMNVASWLGRHASLSSDSGSNWPLLGGNARSRWHRPGAADSTH